MAQTRRPTTEQPRRRVSKPVSVEKTPVNGVAANRAKPAVRTRTQSKPVATAVTEPGPVATAETEPAPVATAVPAAAPPEAVGPDTLVTETADDREVSVGTDAAFASSPSSASTRRMLRNISEVRHFFRTNDVPVYFIGATPFNLLGLDRWVRRFSYITYYDAWDGAHPRVFTPVDKPYQEFASGEEINNWLLRNHEVRARMSRGVPRGVRPKVAMVFSDAETEAICDELGYDLILPPTALRERLDSKIVTTQLGNEAGAPSVPNVLTTVQSWEELSAAAEKAGL